MLCENIAITMSLLLLMAEMLLAIDTNKAEFDNVWQLGTDCLKKCLNKRQIDAILSSGAWNLKTFSMYQVQPLGPQSSDASRSRHGQKMSKNVCIAQDSKKNVSAP